MRARSITTIALMLIMITAAGASETAQILDDLRDEIASMQADWGVPGVAVGIIHNGKVILAEVFGSRDLAGRDPIDTATLFRIGSCSKALAAFSIGLAMEREEISSNGPLKDTLPDFGLDDEWASEKVSVGDLLTHQSSLGRYSLLSHGSQFTRAELGARVRHLPAASGFRERFVYSNLNYTLAAYALEVATDRKWEDYMLQEVFTPLGMKGTCFEFESMVASGNYALPYQKPLRDLTAPAYELGMEKWSAFNPAGGVISNVDDLLLWLQLCLDEGQPLLSTRGRSRALARF